ncbi:MAG: hypothetical protein UU65_C0006G0016 [candidate division CPR2 bacterium GW2011_GWC1_41_48]|uniref:Uncharacterized protein n=1 Tax=candidate division CPR2 bacterium GW2011_GWC1_41_48 TaxID=1618344 RepID=A0A0G0YGH5_UNCC2|nr:MAG: hypothetical protein UT47_C0006G0002 [candidate division CPR2 bacterium GW2011_GWC2_39_35]KKR27651.1 MAG: hypothetical protein UT60_C0042G0005 [candidate division CPR2 bacterium GW2011_GWD2_39_7]KKS08646.1 MAG: hypothetical protein UU65_C0006G0016 [candidate division CPR2 bacterium GW2011_GWC1_41_48]
MLKGIKKEIYVIVAVQILCTLVVVLFLNQALKGEKAGGDSATINSLSARLGQVQMDLYQIKSKLGAGGFGQQAPTK